jgi:DNA-binding NtrC family response regulator
MSNSLKSEGYKIFTAPNGMEAINLISIYEKSDQPVDLIIIDTETWKSTESNILENIKKYKFKLPVIVTYLEGDIFPKTNIKGPFPSAIVPAINMEKILNAIDKNLILKDKIHAG